MRTLWFRLVDFGTRPPISSQRHDYIHRDAESGMYYVYGIAKKAWLQSSPWIVLSLLFCLLAVWWWIRRERDPGTGLAIRLGILMGAVLAAFALAGSQRTDGLSFNQRYFLEILPFAALVFSLAVEDFLSEDRRVWLVGGVLGALGAGSALLYPETSTERLLLIRWLPLVFAVGGVIAYLGWRRFRSVSWGRLATGWVAATLVWSAWIHLGSDLPASRDLRSLNHDRIEQLRAVLPDAPAAIFGYAGTADAPGALMLEREIVVLDAELDDAEDASRIREALWRRGDRVFLLRPMPAEVERRVVAGQSLAYRGSVVGGLYEILPAAPPAP